MIDDEFPDFYTLADEIGRGAYFVNKRCIDLRDAVEYDAKIIDLKKLAKIGDPAEKDVIEEIRICQKLKHEHIIEIIHTSEVNYKIYVVRELVTGVDLCYEIINKVNQGYVYSEVVASHYMRQVFEGLEYIHKNGIIHRDIKPHNIMIASTEESAPIKIGEFGIAVELPECGYIQSGRIGTPHFMAPEVVKREPYGCKVDVWGCGVILFILLGGTFPFGGAGEKTFDAISRADYKHKMSESVWNLISDIAKELIHQLLEINPEERLCSTEALHHPWLSDRDTFAEKLHLEESVNALKQFNARRKLKGAVLATMASRKLTNGLLLNIKNRSKMMDSMEVYEEGKHKMVDVKNAIESFDTVKDMFTEVVDGIDERVMNDDNLAFLRCLLQNDKLRSLMKIYSLSQDTKHKMNVGENQKNAEECLYEVSVLLTSLNGYDPSVKQLKYILGKSHVKSLLKSHDDIIKTMKGKDNILPNIQTEVEDQKVPTNQGTELLTRVRLVQFPKNPNEPMGITLKKTMKNECLVARIIYGGMIHRQGTLHVGDEIKEINGVNVSSCSVEKLQQLLRDASGDVTFKIIPGSQNEDPGNKETYFKCLFDYDPRADNLIPCQQAGLSFNCGDIIEVVSKTDMHWWQARKIESKQVVGLVPSTELQEQRIRNVAMEKKRKDGGLMCILPKKQKPKKKSRSKKYTARFNTAFDKLDLVTYEEVIYQKKSQRKSIVLIGAHGVGRRHIKNSLITRFPSKYGSPLPHTSRKPKPDEEDGTQWCFESEEKMLKEIANHQYLEYGKHEGNLYGTKISSVKAIIQEQRLPILDIETPALKLIRCKEFCPYIIFISSPSSYPESGDPKMDTSLQRLVKDSADLKNRYQHFFDYTIINNTIDETVETLVQHLQEFEESPEWIPAAWHY